MSEALLPWHRHITRVVAQPTRLYVVWKVDVSACLINHDFAGWLAGEGVWEVRTTSWRSVPWQRRQHVATCRSMEDAEATVDALAEQIAREMREQHERDLEIDRARARRGW